MYPNNNNNNNRGGIYYPNQNNSSNNIYRPNANIYQPMNNYKPPQGPYPNNYNQNSNYNQNNYYNPQQQNYGNQNQNAGPKPFIAGYIGRCKISSEDLQTFSKSIKDVEWTTNVNYLQAQNIPVRTKIVSQGENRNDVFIPRHRFNDYYLNSNFKPNEIVAFITEMTDTNRRTKEQYDKEKNDFLKINFPDENADINITDLYQKIGQKRKDIIYKDSNLYGKVERLLPLIQNP